MPETVHTYKLGPDATRRFELLEGLPIEEGDITFVKVHIEEKKKEIKKHKLKNYSESNFSFQLWLLEEELAAWELEEVEREKLIEMSKNGPPYYNW